MVVCDKPSTASIFSSCTDEYFHFIIMVQTLEANHKLVYLNVEIGYTLTVEILVSQEIVSRKIYTEFCSHDK